MSTTREHLTDVAGTIAARCKACLFCQKECAFLKEHGMPDAIAQGVLDGTVDPAVALECSLCGLCTGVCTVRGLDPAALFRAMRATAMEEQPSLAKRFKPLLSFETVGLSRAFSFVHLPEGGDTVLFPRCNMPGSRPDSVWECFLRLREASPALGLALTCCAKPSRMLGLRERHRERFGRMAARLQEAGVRRVLTMCPNCHVTLSESEASFAVHSVWEELDGLVEEPEGGFAERVRTGVHDPCVLRSHRTIHETVRSLLWKTGSSVAEMRHAWHKAYCCGEGGGVRFLRPEFADAWREKRLAEATERRVATYCGGCARQLGPEAGSVHLLDLVLGLDATPVDQWPQPPMTYLARLSLKRKAAAFFRKG